MSDTTAGLLQVGLLIAALAVCYRPLGGYMARVYTSDHDTCASSAASTGSWASTRTADQRWPVYARARARLLGCDRARPVRAAAAPGPPAAVASGFPGVAPDQAFNTAASFVTNTNWQSYSGEVDDGPPGADGRAGRAELRLGRRRHGGRRRAGPRLRPLAHRPDRQLLGRPRPRHRAHPAAARRRRRGRADRAGRRPEPLRRHRRSPPWPAGTRRSPADRSPRRRRSRSSAPTAAASTTPTRRTRSRTPTRSATCSRSSCCC